MTISPAGAAASSPSLPRKSTILFSPRDTEFSRYEISRMSHKVRKDGRMNISIDDLAGNKPSMIGGTSENTRLAIDTLTLQGKELKISEPGVTAFVGGNNVGKSTLLRQISTWISSNSRDLAPQPRLLDSIELEKSGSPADLISWLHAHRPTMMQNGKAGFRYNESRFLDASLASYYWSESEDVGRLSTLGTLLVYYAGTQQRLEMSQPAPRREDFTEPAANSLQRLEDEPALLDQLSRISQEAFQQPLLLDSLSGQLMLRVGDPGVHAPPIDSITPEYREALGRLLPLHEQGDGMRSMLGLLLPIVASTYPVVIVDEPEAFLHPPQARILGRQLADLSESRHIQIVLATHDKNILTGILDSPSAKVSVVRLTRQAERTSASQIPAAQMTRAWDDPSLRYTNILDGLFHRGVILAENERDCRFYASIAAAEHEENELHFAPHDLLFVPTAGKTNMQALAAMLRVCGVPTVATVDLDLLNNEATLKKLVESLGGSWQDISEDYKVSTAEFRQPRRPRLRGDVLGSVASILNEEPDGVYDKDVKSRVSRALSLDSPWQSLKEFGMSAFKAERSRAELLVTKLDEMGVVLVQVGELENFAPALQVAKGPEWVAAAIEEGSHRGYEARKHLQRMQSSLVTQETMMLDSARGAA